MKMRKLTGTLILLFLISCTAPSGKTGRKVISVSILPQKYFTEAIAGDKFEINVLVPPGASPETYEPTALQMKDLSGSVIYFRIGHIPFEKAWLTNLAREIPGMKVYDLSTGIELLSDDHHDEEGVDPHIWSSARNARIMASGIHDALVLEDPANKDFYGKNLQKFLALTDSLDSAISKQLEGLSGKPFLIFHPALGYFAKDYGLNQVAVEFEGKTPSPGDLRDLINIAREHNIRAILVQKQFNSEPAEVIAGEIPAEVIVVDPLDENWAEQMEHITASIVKAAGITK